jgi:transposase
MAAEPVDFRMSIDGLASLIGHKTDSELYDGNIYVFHNKYRDKIKCLFWDRNGFVLYYKRLDRCKFKIKKMLDSIESITPEDLEVLLAGMSPMDRQPDLLEHRS